jgi:S-adenosylmethionine:tRNA ribosyltransferase-isomerase
LDEISEKGVKTARVTLHVGVGTFSPVRLNNVEEHRMHAEWYSVPDEAERAITEAGRVVAVGTTVARTLESFAQTGQREGDSELFIYPGYR